MNDLDKADLEAYRRAKAFSKELNDTYTRTYAQELTGSQRTGANKLIPETLVQKAFNNANDVTNLRMEESIGAVNFLKKRYDDLLAKLGPNHPQVLELAPFANASADATISVREAQKQWLLLGANKLLKEDPKNPGVLRMDRTKLGKFVLENERYLKRVGIWDDLQDVDTAEALLKTAIDQNSAFNKGIKNQAAFAVALGTENPARAINAALNGRNPVRSLERLVTLARNADRRLNSTFAMDGLKAVLFDRAITSATKDRGFSPTAFWDELSQPIGLGQPSILNVMLRNGAMTLTERNNIRRMVIPMQIAERAMGNQQELNKLFETGTDFLTVLTARMAGARAGALIGGGGLVMPAAVSRLAVDLVTNQPTMLIREVLEKAMQDPAFLADLLRKAPPPSAPRAAQLNYQKVLSNIATSMSISGFNQGLPATLNMMQYEPPADSMERGGPFGLPQPAAPRPPPTAPATRGTGSGGPPNGIPAGPQASAAPSGAATDLARLQKAFPFDTTLGMA